MRTTWEGAGTSSGIASFVGSPPPRVTFETRRAGASGGRCEDVEPGYRYNHEMSKDPRYKGRAWDAPEPDLRAGYGE